MTPNSSRSLLVTGCYRSGTTLTEKLLHMHPEVSVASQPFPILYILVKEKFLERIGLSRRYALDHLFGEGCYSNIDFRNFLNSYQLTQKHVDELFDRLESYVNGLWTPSILEYRDRIEPGSFLKICNQLLLCTKKIFQKTETKLTGSKEVLVEEYTPYLLENGYQVVLSVRDPRAMIASLNFSRRDNQTGINRPILFSIRAWRKSVAFLLELEEHSSFHWLRYEDLALKPETTLQKLTNRLELDPHPKATFGDTVLDQFGQPWSGNSSFRDAGGISKSSVARFRDTLPPKVHRYIESLCSPEMAYLGYDCDFDSDDAVSTIRDYQDPFPEIHPAFSEGYSSSRENIEREIERMKLLSAPVTEIQKSRLKSNFITIRAWEKLQANPISRHHE